MTSFSKKAMITIDVADALRSVLCCLGLLLIGASGAAAQSGSILSVTQPVYVGGQASTVTVRVVNTSSSQDYIVDYGSIPSGWSISPGSRNPVISAGATYNAVFTVTPPLSGGSGTIRWQFKEDGFFSNPILDTFNDGVSAASGAAAGSILSVTQPTYIGGQSTSVTVRVVNSSALSQDYIIDYGSIPSGWSISPGSRNPVISAGGTYNAVFSVTPPVNGGSGTIRWQFKEDGLLSNPILHTFSDGVSAASGAAAGRIVSVSQPTFVGGQSTNVTVGVLNSSPVGQDYIIDYGSIPSGWSVSPGSRNPVISAGATYNAVFSVTPPVNGGSGTIRWQFKEDGLLSNPTLDTFNDGVSAASGAAAGSILSVTQPTYIGGQSTSVTVRVVNASPVGQDYIIDYGSIPSGWSVSPGSLNPVISAGATYNAVFTVTPPLSGGSGTIRWQFKEDGLLSNPILDTFNDGVSAASGAAAGRIVSVSQPSFVGGQSTNVTVRVFNSSPVGQDYVIDHGSLPLGWEVSPANLNPEIAANSSYDAVFVVTPPLDGGTDSITWRFKEDSIPLNPILDSAQVSVSAAAFPLVSIFYNSLLPPPLSIADKNYLPDLDADRFDDLDGDPTTSGMFTSNESRVFSTGDTAVISARLRNTALYVASEISIEAWYNDRVSTSGLTRIGESVTPREIFPVTNAQLGLEWVPPSGRYYVYVTVNARINGASYELDSGWVGDGGVEEYIEVNSDTPVILIHGWGGGESSFGNLELLIESVLSRPVRHFEYETGKRVLNNAPRVAIGEGGKPSLAQQLQSFLQSPEGDVSTSAAEISSADVVAHSMGGLVARYYATMVANDKIRRLVTLGTPNYGGNFAAVFDVVLNNQANDLEYGASLLWDLDRAWRGASADLPEVLAVVGTDNCLPTNYNNSDFVVRASSASLEGMGFPVYYVPRPHSSGNIFPCVILGRGLADLDDTLHPSWLPISRFLSGDSPPFAGAPGNNGGADDVGSSSHDNPLESGLVYVVAQRAGPEDRIPLGISDVAWNPDPSELRTIGSNEESGIYYVFGRRADDEVSGDEFYSDYTASITPTARPVRQSSFRLKAGETFVSVVTYDPCGDGILEAPETCDDEGTVGGDGCSSLCSIEPGYTCSGQPSSCDAICGDGLVRGGEACDDGLLGISGCCTASCQIQIAGVACRDVAGVCDVAEVCDGSSSICPTDLFRSTEFQCRDRSGQCDVAEACQGSSPDCPDDRFAQNATLCNDGDACTRTDICLSGSCVGGDGVVCTALDQCHDAGICDSVSGVCSIPRKPNGVNCNDGNACTQSDTCASGVCRAGVPVECVASDQCHDAGSCDPATGSCSNPLSADGTLCDDGIYCNGADSCAAGACDTHLGDPCPGAVCAEICTEQGDGCHCVPEACGDGILQSGRGEECDDGNLRNDDSCTELCLFSQCGDGILDPNTEECDDGNLVDGDRCSSTCEDEMCTGFVSGLGDNQRRLGLDRDVYEFAGASGEGVIVAVLQLPGGSGSVATVTLVDENTGAELYVSKSGELPIELVADLPQTGRYLVVVRALSGNSDEDAYRGNYCVELGSDSGASTTLRETSWVE